ncbi:phosphatidate cytidylyltransferase [Microbacterium sp.]|uniref:phosphatidate cytidylyltransferase n=1 Tax=Microbacterium sp. TaxID=51671 RepID=UPI0025EF9767|nr:phosphatidate cytidylyltransferase [Microbacterium sp.]
MTDPSDSAATDDVAPAHLSARPAAETNPSFHEQVRAARSELEQQVGKARADFEQVQDRINERTGRNLLLATLIALAIGAVVLGTLLFVKWLFLLFALPVCLLGVYEFSRALQTSGRRVDVWPHLAAALVITASGFFLDHWTHWVLTFVAVAFVIVWRLLAQMAAADGRTYGEVLSDVLVAGLIQIYVPFLAGFTLVLLRQDQGEYWLLAMIVTVVAADTGAYATGLALGRHPMAPRISPKKTWEGFAGAAVAAAAAATLFAIFVLHSPAWTGVVFGLVMLVSATLGDLGESMIKRDLGIKDMSSWLPGHGGVLDRLDSILPSAPAALAMYVLFFPLVGS